MKPRSTKLRVLITLYVLWKYTDNDHRLISTKLNEFLKPYNLESSKATLSKTAQSLRDWGLKLDEKHDWNKRGICLKDRPLSGETFNALICAIATNPHLTKSEVKKIFQSLIPCVTVYQEPLLTSVVETKPNNKLYDDFYEKYGVVHNAIVNKRRVRYRYSVIKFNKENGVIEIAKSVPNHFTPKCIYSENGKTYMLGYNNTYKKQDVVDIDLISEIKVSNKHDEHCAKEVESILKSIDVKALMNTKDALIYEGPITFKCKAKYLLELYRKFGSSSMPTFKDLRSMCTYHVEKAAIYSSTLYDLVNNYDNAIRIIGPEVLQNTIKQYFNNIGDMLFDPVFNNLKE